MGDINETKAQQIFDILSVFFSEWTVRNAKYHHPPTPPHPLNLQIYSIHFLLFYFLYINKKVGVLCEMYIKT